MHTVEVSTGQKGRKHRTCQCPISVEGSLRGAPICKAARHEIMGRRPGDVREWETLGAITGEAVTVEDAVTRYLADCKARNLKTS